MKVHRESNKQIAQPLLLKIKDKSKYESCKIRERVGEPNSELRETGVGREKITKNKSRENMKHRE
ncbi:hypothetical protein K9N08_04065 [Candidatus Gracilibacteria bacterium]|nr:hypothetical protein [Candidatus Gracilibacteria bacterium]MCF7856692.1 hypothetical protein [Candidatus Gracilibacteria bacterium]MCF7897008.1 hypothetical protein [Candidatus Gracilibacteria bacterium]